jgi:DNA polymerase-3 subunit alpha
MKYVPLHAHSHFSLLDGLSQPKHMAARTVEIGSGSCALTDHGTVSGVVQFHKAIKNVCQCGKQKDDHPTLTCSMETFSPAKLKPIIGCELYISKDDAKLKVPENKKLAHIPVLSKSYHGWKQLIQITSASNDPDHFYYHPRLSLEQLATYLDGSIIGFSGHLGSHIANAIVEDDKIKPNWEKDAVILANYLQVLFGKGNFYLESQRYAKRIIPIQIQLSDCITKLSQLTGIPVICTPDAHYAFQEQASDQAILLCRSMGVTIARGKKPDFQLNSFFNSDAFYIPSAEEMIGFGHTEEELDNTLEIADKIESYEITKNPQLPPFACPAPYEGQPKEYLRYLCREGWGGLAKRIDKSKYGLYGDRVKHELDVVEGANLSGYFLICQDILNFIRKNGWLAGSSRGSCGGSIISRLTGITSVDPIKYDLLFERFYNAGRNTAENISLPDIDMDVPATKRDAVIDYIKQQYGHDKVCQMITLQTMKGRAALKDVFSAYGDMTFDEINRITKLIPEPSKVAGELQHMKEETGEASLIRFALEEKAGDFAEWCTMNDNGVLQGPLAHRFEQAMRLEGTKIIQSKHAAGVIISQEPLSQCCPMVYDPKKKTVVAGMEMNDLEAIGMVKMDILGLTLLDKIMGAQQILEFGDIIADERESIDEAFYDSF